MSDKDEPKADERDSDQEDDREDDDREDDDREDDDREDDDEDEVESAREPERPAPKEAAAKAPASTPNSRVGVFVVLALLAGGAAGWFGHIQQAKAALKADSAAPAGSGAAAGPCGTWEQKICTSSGAESSACQQAKGAAELLTPSTCEQALTAVPATLTKLKAARASCDRLVTKLCADLPPGSKTCEMVKEKTPSFPTPRCDGMLKQYDQVIGQLKQMDAMGGPGGLGGPGGPGGHGGPRPGMVPQGAPHGLPPQ